ncbi:S-adenosylmethionine decarboxylase family protein [Phocaeicola vulgatus]|uniref:S-adenosylmethionine decarboxylase family protein n=1 Tax=Phocaeicola vulgatus TaxID=821 RepID=UPI003A80BD1C
MVAQFSTGILAHFSISIYIRKAGFNVLSCTEHHFSPQGYTALWLLSESHFAVHTFPEFGRTYIELSSCNLDFYLNFLSMTKEL